jgi:hypothetical protein
MDEYPSQLAAQASRGRRNSLKPFLIVGVASFAIGASLIGYFAWRANPDLFFVAGAPAGEQVEVVADQSGTPDALPAPSPSATATRAAERTAQAVERVEEQAGGFEQRLVAAEQRLARLDLQAQAASGNAARAEGLLIAFATRRSLTRGAELGYLADQLRLRFGDAMPNAVETVIEFSRAPVTLDVLIARLDGIAPSLEEARDESVLGRVRRELGELFVIRRENTPSPQPSRRIERARFFLESGRVDRAIEEVRNLPGATDAQAWIRDAARYSAAQRALDRIETAAVLEPRRLRDGEGRTVEQLSPLQEGAS